jgi:HPt (histidine-containing phosphotransfer) domain-containing protein
VNEQKQGVSGSFQEIITSGPELQGARFKTLKREGFDPDSLWDRIDGDMDLLRDLIGIFAKEYPGILLRIESAINQGEGTELQKASHKLKGSVLQFSASGAAAAAANLEDMGKTGNLDGAGASLAQLKSEVGALMESLNAMIQRGSSQ